MKPQLLLLAASACLPAAFAGYNYDYANLLNPYSSSQWIANGTVNASNNMYTASSTEAGSLIWNGGSLSTPNNYEVRTTLTLTASGGSYISYLRADSSSLLVAGIGTFYAAEIASPVISGNSCWATLNIYKQTGGGTLTLLTTTGISCHNGMVVRTVMAQGNGVIVYIDNSWTLSYYDGNPIGSGQPGVGVQNAPYGNGISAIDIGHLDTVPPTPVNVQQVGTSSFANHIDFQFPGAVDDANGIGVAYYQFWRNGNWLSFTQTPQFVDTTVAADTPYTYWIQAVDYHNNTTLTTVTVRTPPSGVIDPRRVGVRPLGTYWGSGGEQIDVRSANVNYTMPLLRPMARGGWSIGISLSYNSQNWRQDQGGTWQLGRDLGYGYGWRLQAGSLTPVYSGYWTIDHYLYIDSTGAEYRLYNNNGVWTSTEGIYVYYDSNVGRLYFRDGSFWVLGSLSAGTEQDAGSMYPTLFQDSNGNQIALTYKQGTGTIWSNSSSRINTIVDVRNGSYTFTYNSDSVPHLTAISNTIGTSENYTFGYISSYPLNSPFVGNPNFGTYTMLQCANSVTIPGSTTFAYDGAAYQSCNNYTATTSGPGELTRMTTPAGAYLRWSYSPFTYIGSRTQREVSGRYLSSILGGQESAYGPWFQGDPNLTFHTYSGLDDPDGLSQMAWVFVSNPALASYGLVGSFEHRPHHWPNLAGEIREDYGWATNGSNNPYISSVNHTDDNGNPGAITKAVTQTTDEYGNLTQMQVYNYGNLSTPARTYANTYLNNSNYIQRYILNRLATSTVTDGTKTATLAQNYYDSNCCSNVPNMPMHDASLDGSNIYRGNLSSSTTPSGTETASFDIGGNVTSKTLNGVSSTVTTNSSTNYAAPSQIATNSLSTSLNWTGFLGLSSTTGPNGDTASIGYSSGDRPSSSTAATGAVTTYSYNDTWQPSKTATTKRHWTKSLMDGFRRTLEDSKGYSSTTVSTVKTSYAPSGCTPLGKFYQVSLPYAPGGNPIYTTYHYDGLGRTTSVIAPDGSTTTYSYAGNTVTVTDPASKWKKFTIDAFGNLSQVQEPDPSLGNVSTSYTYDVLNHLTQVSMPRGSTTQTRTFNYASGNTVGGLLLSATNPENGTINYSYNSDTTLANRTDAKGQQFTYQYDSYKRLTSVTWTNAPGGAQVLRTNYYDTNTFDGSFTANGSGRLVAVQNPSFTALVDNQNTTLQFTEMYSYTQAGQPNKKRLRVNSLNLDTTYNYDNEGAITSVNYSSSSSGAGNTYTYSFDSMHRPNALTDQYSVQSVSNVQYNAADQLLSLNYFGTSESRTYNSLYQLTNIRVPGILNLTYNFPPAGSNNGKISSQTNALSGETVTYQYDSLKRLLSASGSGWAETYGYDAFGNLVSKTPTAGSPPALSIMVNPATNQAVGYSYDNNGNQLTSPTFTTLTYDAENRLSSAPGVQYAYDSQNERIFQATQDSNGNSTGQEVYVYGMGGQRLGAYSLHWSGGQLVLAQASTAVFFGSKRVAVSGAAFVQDRIGSQVNSQNAQSLYYPFGEDKGTAIPNDQIKFATYTRDSASGLDYADQRYYSNVVARFLTPITIQVDAMNPQSLNRYSYVQDDPANYYDPTGNFVSEPSFDIFMRIPLSYAYPDLSIPSSTDQALPASTLILAERAQQALFGNTLTDVPAGMAETLMPTRLPNILDSAQTFSLNNLSSRRSGAGVGQAAMVADVLNISGARPALTVPTLGPQSADSKKKKEDSTKQKQKAVGTTMQISGAMWGLGAIAISCGVCAVAGVLLGLAGSLM